MRRAEAVACVIVAVCVAGCNLATPKSEPTPRYQFQKDSQGRLFRLDTATGELMAVDTFTPVGTRPSNKETTGRPAVAASKASSPALRRAPKPISPVRSQRTEEIDPERSQPAPSRTEPPPELSSPVPATNVPATLQEISRTPCEGGTLETAFVVADGANVFLHPQDGPVPMATLLRGTPITILDSKGEWRLVRFSDKRWGQRAGYIHCSWIASSSPGLDPVPIAQSDGR
jgi:hypothetical protein